VTSFWRHPRLLRPKWQSEFSALEPLRKHGARMQWLVQQLFVVAPKVFVLAALKWLR
jgi:hypothetical protein